MNTYREPAIRRVDADTKPTNPNPFRPLSWKRELLLWYCMAFTFALFPCVAVSWSDDLVTFAVRLALSFAVLIAYYSAMFALSRWLVRRAARSFGVQNLERETAEFLGRFEAAEIRSRVFLPPPARVEVASPAEDEPATSTRGPLVSARP